MTLPITPLSPEQQAPQQAVVQAQYAQKNVLVLGLGESGLSMVHWLQRCGARVRVADTREAPERLEQLRQIMPASPIEFVGGRFTTELLDGIDFIAVSPGLSVSAELAELVPEAASRDIPVWSEIELFAQALTYLAEVQQYHPKVIAITGTNGKTTVTSLVGLLVERAGKSVKVAGNISPAALDVLRTNLDQHTLPDVWVLELSSFQLHSTMSLVADAATVLNLSQDHLDWHGSMTAYASDKARIFSPSTIQVINRDDPLVMQMANKKMGMAPVLTFGLSAPVLPGEFGLHSEYGVTWLSMATIVDDDSDVPKRKNRSKADQRADAVVEVSIAHLMPADALRIRGSHNATNALAALALCRAIDLPLAPLLHGLREYQGEPHRVEYITTIGDVAYYDDSKGTNVGATVAAINGLAKPGAKLMLIAGGVGKGQDFTPLAVPVANAVGAVFLIGLATEEIEAALTQSPNAGQAGKVDIVRCDSMEHAVQRAAEYARSGDIVLLSPACASFDMFKNYAHRAQVFVDAVTELGYARGEVGI